MTEPRPIPIVACLAGDGIGPEVMAEAGRVIHASSFSKTTVSPLGP